MEELQLRARIRLLRDRGEVPCDDVNGKLWAGRGTGEHCAICTATIGVGETEFEVELSLARYLRVHRRCYYLWREECGDTVETR